MDSNLDILPGAMKRQARHEWNGRKNVSRTKSISNGKTKVSCTCSPPFFTRCTPWYSYSMFFIARAIRTRHEHELLQYEWRITCETGREGEDMFSMRSPLRDETQRVTTINNLRTSNWREGVGEQERLTWVSELHGINPESERNEPVEGELLPQILSPSLPRFSVVFNLRLIFYSLEMIRVLNLLKTLAFIGTMMLCFSMFELGMGEPSPSGSEEQKSFVARCFLPGIYPAIPYFCFSCIVVLR